MPMRLLYTALFYLLVPGILARMAWRSRRAPEYRKRWNERFAFYRYTPVPDVVWFHAVSVGECEAAFPLIRVFQARMPKQPILVTTTTPTGSARVRAVLGDSVQHVYLPYDLPDAIGRFLAAFRPVLGIILETEIWPNLYAACGQAGVPIAIVNGRLSARSARGYGRLRGLTAASLANLAVIAAQTEADAARYQELGMAREKLFVAGNVKFDVPMHTPSAEEATLERTKWFGDRPVWVAGSTHPGEETQVLAAHAELRRLFPRLLLILAPRHPERAAEVLVECEQRGFTVISRSAGTGPVPDGAEIFVLDTIGELRRIYGFADVAFVGGSLAQIGGHNVLEPAASGYQCFSDPICSILRRSQNAC